MAPQRWTISLLWKRFSFYHCHWMNKPNSNLCLIVNLAPNMGLLSRKWKTILVSFFLLLLVPTIVVLSIILAKNKPLSTTSDLQKADSSKMYQDLYVRTNPHKVYLISVGEETGPLEYRYAFGYHLFALRTGDEIDALPSFGFWTEYKSKRESS